MIIAIEEAKPGMTLLEDVLLPNGSVLVNASQALSPPLIETLKKRGIRKIQVVSEQEAKQSEKQEVKEAAAGEREEPGGESLSKKEAEPTAPNLRIAVAEDAMSAKLYIEPTESPNQVLDYEDIIKVLSENDIAYGINDPAIKAVLEKWKKYKRYYEINDVAKGALPQPGRDGAFEVKVKHLSTSSEIEEVKKARFIGELRPELPLQRVDAGTVIAQRLPDTPPVPGKNIKGEAIPTTDMVKIEFACDGTAQVSGDGRQVVAQATGFTFFVDNRLIGVIGFNFDGSLSLAVPPDRMKAELLLRAPGPGGKAPAKAVVASLLSENNVRFGVKRDVIDSLFAGVEKGRYPQGPVVVAEGVPPKNGDDGSVKFLFNTESSLKPKVNQDGSVDYKSIDIVTSVTKGQQLASLLPPTKGTAGRDVCDKELPAVDGVAAKLPKGQNTDITTDNMLVASTDGNVRFNGTNVEITEGFVVKGDVDFSTGNIKYAKSVVIGGDIKSGFRVECGGDLQVAGTVEDAEIVVNGNVLCKLGFMGSGKGVINAKGDVNLLFMKNQTVKSRQNITIAKEALNSTILARKTITVHGNPLSVAGGRLMARDEITVYAVGNMSGIKTVVEIGTDFTLIEELEKTDAQLAEIAETRGKIVSTVKKYEHTRDLRLHFGAKEEFLLAKLKATQAKYDQQMKTLDERKTIINAKMHNFKSSFVKIEHAAMPGTMFKIGQRHFIVKEEIVGPKSVRLINEEIRVI